MADYSDKRLFQSLTPVVLLFLLALTGCGGGISSSEKKDDEPPPQETDKLPVMPEVNNQRAPLNSSIEIMGRCTLNKGSKYQTDRIRVEIDGVIKYTTCEETDPEAKWAVLFNAGSLTTEGANEIKVFAENYDQQTESLPGYGTLIISNTVSDIDVSFLKAVSRTPERIYVKGSTGVQETKIVFAVMGVNNTKVSGKTVYFSIPPDEMEDLTLINTQAVSDADGNATVIVKSGYKSGVFFTVQATYIDPDTGLELKDKSRLVSVDKGVTSYGNFSLDFNKFSPFSYGISDGKLEVKAIVHDRNNAAVIDGTIVRFRAESLTPSKDEGAIGYFPDGTTCQTIKGVCSVTWVSDGANNAEDGFVTIFAHVRGEENFKDNNVNGIFDEGDEFFDEGEAYLDHKSRWISLEENTNLGLSEERCNIPLKRCLLVSEFQENEYYFMDINNNGKKDDGNGLFDGLNCQHNCSDKDYIEVVAQQTFHQASNEIKTCVEGSSINSVLSITLCDKQSTADNFRPLPSGTKITFSTDEGEITGGASADILERYRLVRESTVGFKETSLINISVKIPGTEEEEEVTWTLSIPVF